MHPTRRFTLHGVLAILLVGIPAGATIAATLTGPRACPVADVPEQRGLSFYQYLVDLGNVRPTDEVSARFTFVNSGEVPLTIEKLLPSCGCLQPKLWKNIETYAPGEHGFFTVRVQTANERPGPREYTIRVKYKDPEPREELLTFRVRLPDNQVTIRPRALVAMQRDGKPTTFEATITDRRAKRLELVNVVTSSDFVTAELGETSFNKQGHQESTIRVTVAGKVPSRSFSAIVTVATNDPSYPFLKVPLLIHGPQSPSTAKNQSSRGRGTSAH
jgi:hypothetical protein